MMTLFHGFSRTLLPSYLVLYVSLSIQQLLQVIIQTTGRRVKLHRFLKKNDEFSKTNYRPISVLPAINNVFKKLLATQLNLHFNGILADNLSAYRKHHSCQTALLRLVEDWKDCLDKDLMVAVMSIDLSKAFDNLPHNLLLAKLNAYGLNKPACILLSNFLNGRQQRVKINDTFTPWMSLTRGVPQGSVLSPL